VGAAQTAPVSRPGRAPINKTGFVPDDKAQNSRPHRTVLYIQTQEGLSQREIEDALQVVEEIVNWHPAKDALSATQKQDLSDLRYKVAPDLKQDRSNLSHLKNQAEQELRTYEARLKKNPKISQDVKALEELWAEFCGACEKLQRHLNRHAGFWRGLKIHWERDKANEPEPDAREAILEAPEGQGDAETDLEDYDGPEEDLDAPEDAEDESLGLFDQNGAGQ
jgi:transcriptional regulator with XRE-family HTH domain